MDRNRKRFSNKLILGGRICYTQDMIDTAFEDAVTITQVRHEFKIPLPESVSPPGNERPAWAIDHGDPWTSSEEPGPSEDQRESPAPAEALQESPAPVEECVEEEQEDTSQADQDDYDSDEESQAAKRLAEEAALMARVSRDAEISSAQEFARQEAEMREMALATVSREPKKSPQGSRKRKASEDLREECREGAVSRARTEEPEEEPVTAVPELQPVAVELEHPPTVTEPEDSPIEVETEPAPLDFLPPGCEYDFIEDPHRNVDMLWQERVFVDGGPGFLTQEALAAEELYRPEDNYEELPERPDASLDFLYPYVEEPLEVPYAGILDSPRAAVEPENPRAVVEPESPRAAAPEEVDWLDTPLGRHLTSFINSITFDDCFDTPAANQENVPPEPVEEEVEGPDPEDPSSFRLTYDFMEAVFEGTGTEELVRRIAAERLEECGWRKSMREQCTGLVRDLRSHGYYDFDWRDIVDEVLPHADRAVPKELIHELADCCREFMARLLVDLKQIDPNNPFSG
uniref:Myb-like domain-containing protein n=1 Tax=Steinernema glaseri TaxID=37863 RepID=A0A1I7YFN7_9BILA